MDSKVAGKSRRRTGPSIATSRWAADEHALPDAARSSPAKTAQLWPDPVPSQTKRQETALRQSNPMRVFEAVIAPMSVSKTPPDDEERITSDRSSIASLIVIRK